MKTLRKAAIIERNHVGMVMKERNLLVRLHCPQMVNMHYAFQDERNLYIVMDVCLGGDLHYQLTHSPSRCFEEEQARFYVASVILGLEYMHSLGVMHRDIKPENLLLDGLGQLKITDLGISMELEDGVCSSTSGTRCVLCFWLRTVSARMHAVTMLLGCVRVHTDTFVGWRRCAGRTWRRKCSWRGTATALWRTTTRWASRLINSCSASDHTNQIV